MAGTRGVREGVCCQQCLKPETASRRLLNCSACKLIYYCSPECQKQHWPLHKQGCKERQAARAEVKETHGGDVIKRWTKWLKDSHGDMSDLVIALLGEQVRTHVVQVVAEYHAGTDAGSKPEFKVVTWKVLSLQELRDDVTGPAGYDMAAATMAHTRQQIQDKYGDKAAAAFAFVSCESIEGSGTTLAICKPDAAQMLIVSPEQIVRRMNS